MAHLSMYFLGGFRVELDGHAVYGFETDKARALLAYLAVEANRPHRRESLACLLWPDRPDSDARANLRQAIFRLRRALLDSQPPHFLLVTSTDLQFNSASDHWLDVAELERLGREPLAAIKPLAAALCGDFLAGFSVPDSEMFQAWVLQKQEHYHRLAIGILGGQIARWEGLGAYDSIAAAARQQAEMEPWLEEAQRRCMRALALAGRRDEALRQYEVCERVLAAELGVEPQPATRALYIAIRDGSPIGTFGQTKPHKSERPGLLSRFVGRKAELGRLNEHLDAALSGQGGVVFVAGAAGSGKTALLETFASRALDDHPELLAVGARCNAPGGTVEPYAPLRVLAEMLFGDTGARASSILDVPGYQERLAAATDLTLKQLSEYGMALVDSLVPASSIGRRATWLNHDRHLSRSHPAWLEGLSAALCRSPGGQPVVTQDLLLGQLIDTLAALAQRRPLLLLLDDLQWADEGTAAFLFRVGRYLAHVPLLTLAAYRSPVIAVDRREAGSSEPVRHPLGSVVDELRRWGGDIVIDLNRADGQSFVAALIDSEPNRLGTKFRDTLFKRTGGHALFTVESLRSLKARGELSQDETGAWVARERVNWSVLPGRVEAAIAERIDHLPGLSRRILSVASVQGDEFSAEIVAALTGTDAREVLSALSGPLARQHDLVRPLTVRRKGEEAHSIYRFTHQLFQIYLYGQLDPVERATLHGAVARMLAQQDQADRRRLSARLAWHYEQAGLMLPAARALYEAGQEAIGVSDFKSALTSFEHGLALLANGPPSAERTALGRLLEVALLTPQRTLEGWGAAAFQEALARTACWQDPAEDVRISLPTLAAQLERLIAIGEPEAALAHAEREYRLATAAGDEAFAALARLHAGMASMMLGRIAASQEHVSAVLAWQTPERCLPLRNVIGQDLAVMAMMIHALNSWKLGNIERALELGRRSVSEAQAREIPYGLTWAFVINLLVLHLVGEQEQAIAENLVRLRRLTDQDSFRVWRSWAEVFEGSLLVSRGKGEAGIAQMRTAMANWQDLGLSIGGPVLATVLADGCLRVARQLAPADRAGRERSLQIGLEVTGLALQTAAEKGTRMIEAEPHRLKGELLWTRLGQAGADQAEACFRQAIAIAQGQGSPMMELRGLLSLLRLQVARPEPDEARLATTRARLRAVYSRFTEGWERRDLREAVALLNAPCSVQQRPG